MKLRSLILVLALLVPSVAMADPISVGGVVVFDLRTPRAPIRAGLPLGLLPVLVGSTRGTAATVGVSYLLEEYGITGLEYLNDGSGNYTSFRFDDETSST